MIFVGAVRRLRWLRWNRGVANVALTVKSAGKGGAEMMVDKRDEPRSGDLRVITDDQPRCYVPLPLIQMTRITSVGTMNR